MKKLKSLLVILPFLVLTTLNAQQKKESKRWLSNAERKTPVNLKNKGVGNIILLRLDPKIDSKMVKSGEELFKMYCSACHKVQGRSIGPEMKGILKLRAPEWLMNMILDPNKMHDKDPIARSLLDEFDGIMANQGLTEKQARDILEYLRTVND